MRARGLTVIAATFAALAILFTARSAAQPAPAQPRWEYASFVTSAEAAGWQSPGEWYTALDVYGVYERLGGKLPKEKVAHTQVLTRRAAGAGSSSRSRTSKARGCPSGSSGRHGEGCASSAHR
jgi:hypothetical protein